jgi:hypothetical protein
MLENIRHYSGFLTLLSGIIGIVFWYKLPNNKSKLFLFSIWFSIILDLIGKYYTEWTGQLNYIIYNLYVLIIFSIYIILLRSLLEKLFFQKTALLFLLFFILTFFLNWFFIQNGLTEILTNSYALGVVFITVLGSMYLFELFSTNLILNYSKSIFFWFVLGVLLFHVTYLPFMLSLKWFLIDYNPAIYGLILFFLNLLMNTSFIIGFICSEKRYNY